MKLLYIEASPRKKDSCSGRVASAFLESYKQTNPDHEIDHLPLFEVDLQKFSGEGANQKMNQIMDLANGGTGIRLEGEWAGVAAEVERLKSADKVLVSTAMWNFSIPYPLKHYFDLVCQPGLTFYIANGKYTGMVTGKPIQFIMASGSAYADHFPRETDGANTDFARPYLEHISRFIGFEDIRFLKIERTGMLAPDELEAEIRKRCEVAAKAAADF